MCLLVLAWQAHPRYRLIVAANRDEFHERPAAPLARWEDSSGIVAGRDLRAGGTWLGVDAQSRFGIITNFRDLQRPREGAPSRGSMIPAYLNGSEGPKLFFDALSPHATDYSGFNLLLADTDSLWYGSNRAPTFSRELPPGIYGLSNHLLDTPWPKLVRVRAQFEVLLREQDASAESLRSALFAMLADREPSSDEVAVEPSAIPVDLARALSAPFVLHPRYGTRCSTVVMSEEAGGLRITERTFDESGALAGEVSF